MSDNLKESPLGMKREDFMKRVRDSVGERDENPTPPVIDDQVIRLADEHDDLLAMFEERATMVSMRVYRIQRAALAGQLTKVLEGAGVKSAGMAVASSELSSVVSEALGAAEISVLDWKANDIREQFDLDAGITDVHAALAETGTLICCTDTAHSRGLSLIPTIHIAIVQASDIVPDMYDYWQRYNGIPNTELPSSQSFITGPSKTADIEGELIVGVHGPGEVHILLIED